MFQQEELILKAYEEGQLYLKYIRRPDIPAQLRLYIAGVALFESNYGQITAMSQRYKISRNFIYQLKQQLLLATGHWILDARFLIDLGITKIS